MRVLSFILLLVSCSPPEPEVDLSSVRRSLDHWEEGKRLLALKKPNDAREEFREALNYRPNEPALKMWLAKAEIEIGDGKKAIALLQELVEKSPPYEAARYNLAAYLVRENQFESASKHLKLVLSKGEVTPYEVVDDVDFQRARLHSAFHFLPKNSLEVTAQPVSESVFLGDSLSLDLTIHGLKNENFRLESGSVTGPIRLLRVIEKTEADNPYFSSTIRFVFEVLGPGTVNFDPMTVRDSVRSATTKLTSVRALAPPDSLTITSEVPKSSLVRPHHLKRERSSPEIWTDKNVLYILSEPNDTVRYSGMSEPHVRYEYSEKGFTIYTIRRWHAFKPGDRAVVMRGNTRLMERTL